MSSRELGSPAGGGTDGRAAVCPRRGRGRDRSGVRPSMGLTSAEASSRLARYGPNQITGEKPPSILVVALTQLRDPMNIMLVAVTAVSFAIGQVSTGVIVGLLILLNVVLGSRQELKARASVDALSNLQVPQAKVVRGGALVLVPAVEVVPGDLVQLEAGDIVPADGRIVRSATLEAQEAALTGESAPVSKDSARPGRGRCRARRPDEHVVPEHLGDQGHRVDGGHRHRDDDPDGSDRHHADLGHPDPVAAAEGTGHPDPGAGHHRLDGGGVHRGGRADPGDAGQRVAAAGHGDGDLGDPDRPAGVRLRDAVLRREAAGRGQGRREEPHRRGDPRARPARSTPTRPAP